MRCEGLGREENISEPELKETCAALPNSLCTKSYSLVLVSLLHTNRVFGRKYITGTKINSFVEILSTSVLAGSRCIRDKQLLQKLLTLGHICLCLWFMKFEPNTE